MNVQQSWVSFEEAVKDKMIVCYGAGVNAYHMLTNTMFQPHLGKVRCFVDRDIRKQGKKIEIDAISFVIKATEQLEEYSDCVVLVTLTDYINVGKMLENSGFEWFAWTIISADCVFEQLPNRTDDDEPKIFLLNTPDYVNLGDQAIAYAEELYIHEMFGEFYEFGTHSCHALSLSKLQQYIKPKDIILFQGGGNLGSLWRVCEEIFRNVLQKFPNNSVIVFPQSIYYGISEEEEVYFRKSQEIYNSHPDLLICTRDRRSYDFVKRSYNCKCMLLPDMVLTIKPQITVERKGIGVLLRTDKEQCLPDDYHTVIQEAIKIIGEKGKNITHHPTEAVRERETRVLDILEQYASCSLIITDRLHGMIFSAITNTPCIAFDNSYCKVSGVYDTWIKGCDYISLCAPLSLDELVKMIKQKTGETISSFDYNKYQTEFGILTDYINCKKRGK